MTRIGENRAKLQAQDHRRCRRRPHVHRHRNGRRQPGLGQQLRRLRRGLHGRPERRVPAAGSLPCQLHGLLEPVQWVLHRRLLQPRHGCELQRRLGRFDRRQRLVPEPLRRSLRGSGARPALLERRPVRPPEHRPVVLRTLVALEGDWTDIILSNPPTQLKETEYVPRN